MDQNEPKERVHDESESEIPTEQQTLAKPAIPVVENGEKAEDLPSDPAQCTPRRARLASWIKRHHESILALSAVGSLITTAVLAVIAYYSWDEVKKQRDLAFKQFVITNAPSVNVYAKEGLKEQNNLAFLEWQVVNKGGYVTDLEFKAILLCCGQNEIENPNLSKALVRTFLRNRLNKDVIITIRNTAKDADETAWLKKAFERENAVIFYTQVKYTIPPELSLSGSPAIDSAYDLHLWVAHANRFESLPASNRKRILDIINERGYLTME